MNLLLHMCCAPCSIYPVTKLLGEGVKIEGLYYNPNIHPLEEFEKRKEGVRQLSQLRGFKVNYKDGIMQEKWENFTGPGEERCRMCYTLRLTEAALFAKENGFDAFTTSLLISPYQRHDMIKELAEKLGRENGIEFYYEDFRPHFREGQQMAKDAGIYRQKYCGCIISKAEAEEQRKNWKKKKKMMKQMSSSAK